MFRIKPTRNQTTAKHVNLSPHPNNNIIKQPNINQKDIKQKNIQSFISKQELNKKIIQTKKAIPKNEILKLTSNVKKEKSQIPQQIINISSHQTHLSKINEKLLLRRPLNKQKKIKFQVKSKVLKVQNIKQPIKNELKYIEQQRTLIKKQSKQLQKLQVKEIQYKAIQQNNILQQEKQIISKKIQISAINISTVKQQFQSLDQLAIQPNTLQLKQKVQILHSQQQLAERQTSQLMQKIRKRRQARQKQKQNKKQREVKQKQNKQAAQKFLAQHNNLQQNSIGGMFHLPDQLLHFNLAQSILDIQILKLLHSNFSQFPNYSQIKYQLQQLERINISYQLVKFDQENKLRNGLKKYRVEIFNRIGDLIVHAQSQGYKNGSFQILQYDHRQPHQLIPQAIKGLPQENFIQFLKFQKIFHPQQCTICLVQIQSGQISVKVECGHKFHQSCIKQWILSSANCPTCRFNIKVGSAKK